MQEADIRRGLLRFENTGMRQNIYEYNGMYLIEDCYNASPESMEAALKVLGDIGHNQGGKAIAVLGDMLELGAFHAFSTRARWKSGDRKSYGSALHIWKICLAHCTGQHSVRYAKRSCLPQS